MKIVMFYHSLVSDWNHGNAHFLRGVVAELLALGHEVEVWEPSDSWSRRHLMACMGHAPVEAFHKAYPELKPNFYETDSFDPESAVRGADLVIAHEWNSPALVARLGELRRFQPFFLLFHDTHHRMVTEPAAMDRYELTHYDGVLAFGEVLRDLYLERQVARRAWIWHEAADTRHFHPKPEVAKEGDLVWIGNWGDEERTAELHEFLMEPVRSLGLRAEVYGVRYPEAAQAALAAAGIAYRGWLPNFQVADVFARFHLTMHVPRRPYARALPGIPTIRPFEALACGIPLVSAPWTDSEHLFTPGQDFLLVKNGAAMKKQLAWLLSDQESREKLARHGLATIRARHTCAHRARELLAVCEELGSAENSGEPLLAATRS